MTITVAPPKPARVFRTLRRIRDYLAERLDEPDLSVKSVEWWAESGRIRTYRFGNQITAREDELDEDLVQPRQRDAAEWRHYTNAKKGRNAPDPDDTEASKLDHRAASASGRSQRIHAQSHSDRRRRPSPARGGP